MAKECDIFSFELHSNLLNRHCHGDVLERFVISPSLIVCVEVLRPIQPNGVMSSAVSLPNHTFTGQA